MSTTESAQASLEQRVAKCTSCYRGPVLNLFKQPDFKPKYLSWAARDVTMRIGCKGTSMDNTTYYALSNNVIPLVVIRPPTKGNLAKYKMPELSSLDLCTVEFYDSHNNLQFSMQVKPGLSMEELFVSKKKTVKVAAVKKSRKNKK